MAEYTKTVVEHFENPRNCGSMEEPDGIGLVGNPSRGDFLTVFIKVKGTIITDVKYLTRGCPVCIAAASIMTELAIGRDLNQAMMIEGEDIINALGGIPENKVHCANRGAKGIQEAVIDHVYGHAGRKSKS
ncbi:MAG: nitrogen-fixing NifU domain protein [Deltaproteobacteria bacterium]|nr:nitrogen-fixing NifU domain protein [Deltaproteobacteria bacterium]